ncbi:glutathione S-transferase N-terminal domain-containing protein [Eggerthella sp. YY7918]|uniref:glutathione S-transferase N-terminal domain-containing protein n=1 Tax=Eggerthella sp. (strain YY7918) TaxID=502558 RepID=UPI001E509D7C|nr:glutathione S-transferase N-terminal domain-containing protein [Eggerthella sp. YY7918]
MDENKITLDTRDILQPGNQNDLVRIGGKKQVPCLVIGRNALYESEDIVAYLRDRA